MVTLVTICKGKNKPWTGKDGKVNEPSKGVKTRDHGFYRAVCKLAGGEDKGKALLNDMSTKGLLFAKPEKGGYRYYLPSDKPESTSAKRADEQADDLLKELRELLK